VGEFPGLQLLNLFEPGESKLIFVGEKPHWMPAAVAPRLEGAAAPPSVDQPTAAAGVHCNQK
jgi:hypothetical protein